MSPRSSSTQPPPRETANSRARRSAQKALLPRRSAPDWVSEPEPVLLDQAGDALEVELEPVLGAQRRELLGIGLGRLREPLSELGEEALESPWRDDLEDPRRLVARVPERVPLVARLEDQIAWAADDDLIAEEGPAPPFEDIAVLVLSAVAVKRR